MKKTNLRKIFSKIGVICLCVFLTVWTRMKVAAAGENADDEIIVVSLGDSYSSGEGIPPFYDQDLVISEKVQSQDWLAHRSELSWPGQLTVPGLEGTLADEENRNTHWFFVASSGAVTADLKYQQEKAYNISGVDPGYGWIHAQLDVFDKIPEGSVDYVTVTIGGNDVGFANIIKTAVTDRVKYVPYINPGRLSEDLKYTRDQLFAYRTHDMIRDAYLAIREKAGEDAVILVAGYPRLVDETSNNLLSVELAREINENVTWFNEALREIVTCCQDAGMKIFFVSVEEAFEGHAAYAEDSYINGVMVRQPEDLKEIEVNPKKIIEPDLFVDDGDIPLKLTLPDEFVETIISDYSMHPNENGAIVYASCVQAYIDWIESGMAGDPPNTYAVDPARLKKLTNSNAPLDRLLADGGALNGLIEFIKVIVVILLIYKFCRWMMKSTFSSKKKD